MLKVAIILCIALAFAAPALAQDATKNNVDISTLFSPNPGALAQDATATPAFSGQQAVESALQEAGVSADDAAAFGAAANALAGESAAPLRVTLEWGRLRVMVVFEVR